MPAPLSSLCQRYASFLSDDYTIVVKVATLKIVQSVWSKMHKNSLTTGVICDAFVSSKPFSKNSRQPWNTQGYPLVPHHRLSEPLRYTDDSDRTKSEGRGGEVIATAALAVPCGCPVAVESMECLPQRATGLFFTTTYSPSHRTILERVSFEQVLYMLRNKKCIQTFVWI
jgi:hypothetical protein